MEAIPTLAPKQVAPIEPYYIRPNGELRAFTRGVDKRTRGIESTRFNSISGYWVNTITSGFDQDVSSLWVGPKGSGKSSAVLSVCYEAAVKIAAWVDDGSKWDDYYNLHELTACILEEEATKLMNIQRKYIIKNFDDIGIGWSARDWRDQDNQQKNDVFQINRTDQAIQCFSVPNQFLLDKVPRSLVSHYVEMDAKIFEKGYTTIKLFKPKTMFREGKIINPFLVVDRNKYVNYIIPAPPHALWTEYKKLRMKNKDIAIKRRAEQKVKSDGMKELELKVRVEKTALQAKRLEEKSKGVGHADWEQTFVTMIPDITKMVAEEGKSVDKAISIVSRRYGMHDSARGWLKRMRIKEKYNLDKLH